MTILANPPSATEPAPEPDPQPTVVDDPPRSAPPAAPDAAFSSSLSPGLFIGWLVLVAVGVLIVWWGLSPSVEQRDQRALLTDYRAQIDSASNEAFGLPGIQVPVNAPALGTPVGVVDAERTGLHVVAVEGSDPAQTRQGAGHIVGTAAPGQPGNSALVGRSHLYGGAFGSIGDLAAGDRILVTTVQGQSAYTVRIVAHRQITDDAASDTAAPVTTTTAAPTPAADPTVASSASSPSTAPAPAAAGPTLPDGPLRPDQLYGPTDDDRLTLVTSDSVVPWSTGDAVVVVAQLDGQPYAPTPQGGRVVGGDGRHGDPGITAALLLAALFMLVAVTAAIWLHRHLPWRSAYLLSAPLVVAATILLAEQLAGTLPGWA